MKGFMNWVADIASKNYKGISMMLKGKRKSKSKIYEEKSSIKIPCICTASAYIQRGYVHAMSLGADGVQVGTGLSTYEYDAP